MTDARVCWICRGGSGRIQRFCRCTGDLGSSHEGCLDNWLTVSSQTECSFCKFTYKRVQCSEFSRLLHGMPLTLGLFILILIILTILCAYTCLNLIILIVSSWGKLSTIQGFVSCVFVVCTMGSAMRPVLGICEVLYSCMTTAAPGPGKLQPVE